MSISVMNMVWGLRADAMTTAQRFVLLALADTADDAGVCFPSTAYLDHKTGMSNRTVRHHLGQLEADGWFSRVRRTPVSVYTYAINLDKLEDEQGLTWRQKRQAANNDQWQEVAGPSGKKLPVASGKNASHQWQEVAGPNPRRTIKKNRQATTSPQDNVRIEGKPNQFPGICIECGKLVKAGQGLLVGKKPVHRPGECTYPPHIIDPTALTEEDFTL